jgi:hypothetical protein
LEIKFQGKKFLKAFPCLCLGLGLGKKKNPSFQNIYIEMRQRQDPLNCLFIATSMFASGSVLVL